MGRSDSDKEPDQPIENRKPDSDRNSESNSDEDSIEENEVEQAEDTH